MSGRPVPGEGVTLLNTNEQCGRSVLAGEIMDGVVFEPKCLVIVVSPENQLKLFEEMVAAGRIMTDEFSITLNYTIGTHPTAPNVELVTSNCMNSLVLEENHELDTVLQAQFSELETLRDEILELQRLQEFWVRQIKQLSNLHPPSNLRITNWVQLAPIPPAYGSVLTMVIRAFHST